jgi:hypothetical protein
MAVVKAALHLVRVIFEFEEEGVPAGGLDEGAVGGGFGAGTAPGQGEGEAALHRVEV